MWDSYYQLGWRVFEKDEAMLLWTKSARDWVDHRLGSNNFAASQLRCAGTWFAGVSFLENDRDGKVTNFSLAGKIIDEVILEFGDEFLGWDSGQVSICYPGYPRQAADESKKAFNYRKKFYGAHVDGIIPVGRHKRRFFKEAHAFVLGIPISKFNRYAAPLVVWEGSHKIIRSMLWKRLSEVKIEEWTRVDITEKYLEARQEIFRICTPRVIWVPLGGAYIVHRHSLHGIMPWKRLAEAEPCGRMVAYFRPPFFKPDRWLDNDV